MSCHHRCLVRLGITMNIHVPNDNEFDFVNDMRVVPLSVPVLGAEMFFFIWHLPRRKCSQKEQLVTV
jgi:hypothetical protein